MATRSLAPDQTLATPAGKGRRRVRWRRVVISSLIIVVALGGLLPSLARPWVVAKITESIPGQVSIENIALSWWSPVTATGIRISTDDQQLLTIGKLRTNESLVSLIVSRSVEHVDLQDVSLEVRHDGDDCNLEAWLRQLPKSEDSSNWSMRVTIKGGQLRIYRDAADRSPYELLTIEATANLNSTKLTIEATGQYPLADQKLQLKAVVQLDEETIKLTASGFDVAGLEPWLCRGAKQSQLRGQLSTTADLHWGKNAFDVQIEQLHIADLDAALPGLGLKPVHLARVEVHGQFMSSPTGVAFDGEVRSNIGTVTATGMSFNLPVNQYEWQDLLDSLRGTCDIELQLAETLASAPWLIPVKDDLELTAGTVKLRIQAGTEPTERLIAEVSLADVEARTTDRVLAWEKPIQLAIDIRRDPYLQVENLQIDSEFITARLNGSLEVGNGTLSGDLGELFHELSQWLDMPVEAMQGKLSGELHWRMEQQRIVARGELDILDAVIQHGETPWSDARIHVDWNSVAHLAEERPPEISAGDLVITTSNQDRLEWHAQQTDEGLTWNGETHLKLAHLAHVFVDSDTVIEGTLDGTANGITNGDSIQITEFEATVDRFLLRGPDMSIREPTIIFRGSGNIHSKHQQVDLDQFEFTSTTFAFAGQKLRVKWDNTPTLSFDAAIRADLSKIDRWIPQNKTDRNRWQGEFVGNVKVQRTPQNSSIAWNGVVDQFSIRRVPLDGPSSQYELFWKEQELKTVGDLVYETADGTLTGNVSADGDSLQLTLRGQILDITGRPIANLTGDLTYDLAALQPKLQLLLDPSIRIAGKDRQSISLRGPIFTDDASNLSGTPIVNRQLEGSAGVAWQSAAGYGAIIGEGEISADLKDGKVTFTPFDFDLAGGRLHAEPLIDLRSSPARLLIMPGPLMTNVNITPEMCRSWIQYAAPLLANATRAQGRFSAQLEQAEFPLGDPLNGSVSGTLTIHEGRIAASPLVQQILVVASQVRAVVRQRPIDFDPQSNLKWVTLPPQEIEFRLIDGAVEHRRFELRVDDVQLVTSGKVYITNSKDVADRRIELVCEVPIREEWIKSNRLLASLRNSKLRIPISGTLAKPQIDTRVLRDFGKQMLRGTAEDLLRDQLEKGLRKLFNNSLP
jgi:hypothetical protein